MNAKEKKSPLTAKPLRNPGQSVDEAIDTLLDDEAGKYILLLIAPVTLAVVEWLRWFLHTPLSPWPYTLIALAASPYAVYRLIKLKKKLKQLKLGRDGEKAVGQYLESFREEGFKIFHDIPGGKFNLDHVLIGPKGILVVETKTYSKPAKGKPIIVYDGNRLIIDGGKPTDAALNQANAQAAWLKQLLIESTGKSPSVKPVIVFPGWMIESKQAGFDPAVWVLNPKALPSFLKHMPPSLNTEEVSLFSYHLSRSIRASYPVD